MKSLEDVEKRVKEELSEKRYFHSVCVKEMCIKLARIYGVDEKRAELVGMAHDIAKEIPNEEKLKYCKDHNIKVDSTEEKNPSLLHAKIGAYIAKVEFGFDDEMTSAISYHTTGKVNMTMLEKIAFVGDAISMDRKYDVAEQARQIAYDDLDKAVKFFLDYTIEKRLKENKTIHVDTVMARNEFLPE